MSLKGSCYCGNVEYTVDDDGDRNGVACHCRTCQKLHTSASYNMKSEVGKVHVTKGSPKTFDDLKADSNKAIHRTFCPDCGSYLWSSPDSMPGVCFVKVGPLDNASDYKLAADIYVESALPHTLNDKSKFNQKHFEGMMAKEV